MTKYITWANFSSVFAIIASNDSRCVKIFLLWTFRWNVFASIGSDTCNSKRKVQWYNRKYKYRVKWNVLECNLFCHFNSISNLFHSFYLIHISFSIFNRNVCVCVECFWRDFTDESYDYTDWIYLVQYVNVPMIFTLMTSKR